MSPPSSRAATAVSCVTRIGERARPGRARRSRDAERAREAALPEAADLRVEEVVGDDRRFRRVVAQAPHHRLQQRPGLVQRNAHPTRYFFAQIGEAIASSGGYTVTGVPFCHCTMVRPASTRRPLSSNLMRPPG